MHLFPVALYGLEVPCGGSSIPAAPDFPANVSAPHWYHTPAKTWVKIRISMAAIDPEETSIEKSIDKGTQPRATLKIIREQGDHDNDDSVENLRKLLAESDSEQSDDDSDDENKNSGPSDPSKTKKARKAAAVKQLMDAITEDKSDEEMDDASTNTNLDKKGKARATVNNVNGSESGSTDDGEVEEFVVCTLDPTKNYQQPLDITIGENERVYFKVTGTHTIYLTGNYLASDDSFGRNNYLDEDEEDSDLSPDEDDLELQSDEEIDELDDLDNPRITEIDSDDEKAPKLVEVAEKKPSKNKRPADEINNDNSLENTSTNSKTGASNEVKLSKKQLKKLKKNNGEAVAVKTVEPKKDDEKQDKNDKKVQFAKDLEQGPSGSSEKAKIEQSGNQKKQSLGVKTVDGIKIDDKKLGSGRACKKGDKVFMRYIGKLVNGSVFDSNKKGTPFSFKLGTGEVIQGWDIGVTGMSAGGERRLTIPPNKGYGNKAMPGIPSNSTLIFDIKMLEVK